MNEKYLVCAGRERVKAGLGLTEAQFVCMVTQLSHLGWSGLVLTWAAILAPQHFYWWWAGWTFLTAGKEFWFDFNVFTWSPGFETNEQSGGPWGDVLDFSAYSAGAVLAWLALRAKGLV